MVDWILGVVGGKVLLGVTGSSSNMGSMGTDKGGIRFNVPLSSVQTQRIRQTRTFLKAS